MATKKPKLRDDRDELHRFTVRFRDGGRWSFERYVSSRDEVESVLRHLFAHTRGVDSVVHEVVR